MSISTSRGSGGGTRDVMGAFGHDNPSALLAVLQDEKQQARVIETHARWDSSNNHHTGYWLALAAQRASFADIVRARLKLDPEDVLTLRAEQDARHDLRAAVCKRHRAMANAKPDSIDLRYVAARCIDDAAQQEQEFTALYAKAPTNGRVAAAMGYTHAEHGRWSDAMAALNVARQRVPAMTERFALDTMRLRRMSTRDGDAQGADLVQQSGILRDSVWAALGLALRERRDPAPYLAAIREEKDDDSEKVLAFITALRSATHPVDAEQMLDGLRLEARGQAYSAALVILGARAPAEWRSGADRLLFVPERPYFSVVL
ncbi:MAG: hypothetical protein ACREXP_23980 [Steroidobacteraceae bacterium]